MAINLLKCLAAETNYKRILFTENFYIDLAKRKVDSNLRFLNESLTLAQLKHKLLSEVSYEAIKEGEVIALDKTGEWYTMQNGKTLRHTKVMFAKNLQQKRFCQAYRYHDPTKAQDKCIYVLLCINYDKDVAVAISTIRKITAKCIKKYLDDWIIVPKGVLKRLIDHLEKNKLADKKTLQMLKQVYSKATPKGKQDRYLTFKELWSKLRKRGTKKRQKRSSRKK